MSATNSNSSTNNNEKLLKSVREQRLEEVKECLKSKCSLTYTDWVGNQLIAAVNLRGDPIKMLFYKIKGRSFEFALRVNERQY